MAATAAERARAANKTRTANKARKVATNAGPPTAADTVAMEVDSKEAEKEKERNEGSRDTPPGGKG